MPLDTMQLTNDHSNQGAFFAICLNQIFKCTATVLTSFYFILKTLKRGFNHTFRCYAARIPNKEACCGQLNQRAAKEAS